MGNFISKFVSQYIKGNIETVGTSGIQSAASTVLQQLDSIRIKLFDTEQMYAEIIPALIYNENVPISDVNDIISDSSLKYVSEISDEDCNTLLTSLSNAYHYNKTILTNTFQVNLSDRLGQVYALYTDVDGIEKVIDGTTYVVYSSFKDFESISNVDDLFLYRAGLQNLMNYRFLPLNYEYQSTVTSDTTIDNALTTLSSLIGWNYSSQIAILENVRLICRYLNLEKVLWKIQTIDEGIALIAKRYKINYASGGNILAILNEINYEIQTSNDDHGLIPRFLGDIIHDLSIADTINNIVDQAIQMVTQGKFIIADFLSLCENQYHDASLEVRNVWNCIASAFNNGGVYALAKYIVDLLSTAQSISVEDGVLVFTNNEDITPDVYLSGIINGSVSVVTSVAAAIISMYNVVLGPIISIGSYLITNIIQGLDYDYNEQTLARVINSNELLTFPVAPFIIDKGSVVIDNNIKQTSVYKQMIDLPGVYYATIPGSYVFLSLDSNQENILYEVHPEICDYDIIWDYNDSIIIKQVTGQTGNLLTYYNLRRTINNGGRPLVFNSQNLIKIWNTKHPIAITGDINGLMNEMEDNILRSCIEKSIALSLMYMHVVVTGESQLITASINNFPVACLLADYNSVSGSTTYHSYKYGTNPGANPLLHDIGRDLCFYLISSSEYHYDSSNTYIPNYNIFSNYTTSTVSSWMSDIEWCTDFIKNQSLNYKIPNITYAQATGAPVINWDSSTSHVINYSHNNTLNYVVLLNNYNTLSLISGHYNYLIQIPKYDRFSFIPSVIVANMAATAIAVTGVAIGFKVRRMILNKRLTNARMVERAWDAQMSDPSTENALNYRKAVRKANIWQKIIGGTKYSLTNYWDSESSGEYVSSFNEYISGITSDAKTSSSAHSSETQADSDASNDIISLLKYLIYIINHNDTI